MLWDGGTLWIALEALTRKTLDGGIALPKLRLYYWAAQLVVVNDWVCSDQHEPSLLADRRILNMGCYHCHLYRRGGMKGLLLQTVAVVDTCKWAVRATGWQGKITLRTPLRELEALRGLRGIEGHKKWGIMGILVLGDAWKEGQLIPFAELRAEYDLMSGQYLRYLQTQHILKKHTPQLVDPLEESPLEHTMMVSPLHSHAVSLIYMTFLAHTDACKKRT